MNHSLTNEVQNGVSIARSRDTLGRPTGYALSFGDDGRFVETSLPGSAGRDAPTARPQGGSRAFTYAYDHRGRMVRKDIQRRGAEPQSIAYTWDGWNIIRDALATNHWPLATTHNVWGLDLDGTIQGAGGVGGLLAVIVPRPMGEGQGEGGTAYLPCYDANGNITG